MNKILSTNNLINTAIIACATFIIGFFGLLIFNEKVKDHPIIGTKLDLPIKDWSKSSKNLVLLLQTTCHYCNESLPFYKELERIAKEKSIRVIAVFPQSIEEGTEHLRKNGINNIEIQWSDFRNLHITGTPTLILVDDKSEVKNYWSGKLSPDQEKKVIESLDEVTKTN